MAAQVVRWTKTMRPQWGGVRLPVTPHLLGVRLPVTLDLRGVRLPVTPHLLEKPKSQ